jgi:hypothetical protein
LILYLLKNVIQISENFSSVPGWTCADLTRLPICPLTHITVWPTCQPSISLPLTTSRGPCVRPHPCFTPNPRRHLTALLRCDKPPPWLGIHPCTRPTRAHPLSLPHHSLLGPTRPAAVPPPPLAMPSVHCVIPADKKLPDKRVQTNMPFLITSPTRPASTIILPSPSIVHVGRQRAEHPTRQFLSHLPLFLLPCVAGLTLCPQPHH